MQIAEINMDLFVIEILEDHASSSDPAIATVSINPSTGAQGSSRTATITSGYGGGVAAITLHVTDTNYEYSTVTVIATVICKLFPSYVK